MRPGILFRCRCLSATSMPWQPADGQAGRAVSKQPPKPHQLATGEQYYPQEHVPEIIGYANLRGIRVLPEADMPAHTTASMVAYPELARNDSVYGSTRR